MENSENYHCTCVRLRANIYSGNSVRPNSKWPSGSWRQRVSTVVKLLSEKQVKRLYLVRRAVLRRWVKSGVNGVRLRRFQIHGKDYYNRRDVVAFFGKISQF